MRHRIRDEQVNEVTETGLFVIGEQRLIVRNRERLSKILAGLEEADRIERARALHRVQVCRRELREAEQELERVDEIYVQKAEVYTELRQTDTQELQTLTEAEREIVSVGKKNGAAYISPELAGTGEARAAVDRRKRLKEETPAPSSSEAEVV